MLTRTWSIWQILLVIGGLVLATRQGASIWRLVKTGDRVKQAQIELEKTTRQNEELKLKLAEVDSPEFVEKEAREKLGLAREGEVVYILPDQIQNSRTSKPVTLGAPTWQKWWDLYIRL